MGLTHDIRIIKQRYREIFDFAHRRLLQLFETLQQDFNCPTCSIPPSDITDALHTDCGYIDWQKQTILTLENTVGKEILAMINQITHQREVQGQCHQCGVCCSLASSEFDYATLQQKAKDGDYFAQQFTSVFLPYASPEVAQAKFPEIVGEIREQTDGDVYFYHCPYLNTQNQCSLYGDPKRPQICADYPETPLILMYKNCGYQPWKEAMLPDTLMAQATLELCQFYSEKILQAVKASPVIPFP